MTASNDMHLLHEDVHANVTINATLENHLYVSATVLAVPVGRTIG